MGVREQLEATNLLEIGKHVIADIRIDKNSPYLNNVNLVRELLYEAAKLANIKILDEKYVVFENTGGISMILFIAESHISIHTWPEWGYAAIDIFTCGEKTNPWEAYMYIIRKLKPKYINVIEIKRGFSVSE
jgi:S-adenosylmethionine decarboxylase proenzyme, Bacillus form